MDTLNAQLSEILLRIEADLWATELTNLAMKTLLESIRVLEVSGPEAFYAQFELLLTTVKTTSPRIGIMISYFSEIFDEIQENKSKIKSMDDIHLILDAYILKIERELEGNTEIIMNNGVRMIGDGDNILVHSPSSMVKRVLGQAKAEGKDFRVTLAQSSDMKTENMLAFLQNTGIPFVVVPEFMLSNIEQDIDTMLVWGITFTSEYKFIVSAGLGAAVSEMHYAKKKIIMLMSTKKFSLWQAETKKEASVKVKKIVSNDPRILPYDQLRFSHDRVDVELFDAIVTEKGVLTPDEIRKEYDASYSGKEAWRKGHGL